MTGMSRLFTFCVLTFVSMACCQGARRNVSPSVSQIEERLVGQVESVIVPAAAAMPEAQYSFVPGGGEFNGVRTFAQQVKHLSASNYEMGSAILGEKPPAETGENGPDSIQGKTAILTYLQNSFTYLHRALSSINEKNQTDEIQSPIEPGTTTKLALATLCLWHDFDHYGQMVEYLRMNGVVPPASRQ